MQFVSNLFPLFISARNMFHIRYAYVSGLQIRVQQKRESKKTTKDIRLRLPNDGTLVRR